MALTWQHPGNAGRIPVSVKRLYTIPLQCAEGRVFHTPLPLALSIRGCGDALDFQVIYFGVNIKGSIGDGEATGTHKGSDSKGSGAVGRFTLCYFGVNLQGKRRQLLRRQYQRLCPCIPGGRRFICVPIGTQA